MKGTPQREATPSRVEISPNATFNREFG